MSFQQLVSSKYLTAFSDHRFGRDLPDFVTPDNMCEYLDSYATKYDLFKFICFDTKVLSVTRRDGGHVLVLQDRNGDSRKLECDAIAVCSGLHVIPEFPVLEGIERVPTVLHSSELKSREQFGKDTNVVIMGAGETAMDLAWLAVTAPTKSVTICHRDGFFLGPKVCFDLPVFSSMSFLSSPLSQDLFSKTSLPRPLFQDLSSKTFLPSSLPSLLPTRPGQLLTSLLQIIPKPVILSGLIANPAHGHPNKPADCAVASLFDTAYVPKELQASQLPWDFYNTWIKMSQFMISGTTNGPDQWAGVIPEERRHVDSSKFQLNLSPRNQREC